MFPSLFYHAVPVTDYRSGFYHYKFYCYTDLDIQTESKKAAAAGEKKFNSKMTEVYWIYLYFFHVFILNMPLICNCILFADIRIDL